MRLAKAPILLPTLILTVISLFFSPALWAEEGGVGGLLIAPTRITIGPRDRSAQLTLLNRGTKVATYRIDLVEKQMTAAGKLVDVPEGEAGPFTASQLLRYSPRQVTLRPGETQRLRILVRRPRDLPAAEYRSHLLVRALPDVGDGLNIDSSDSDQERMRVRLVTLAALSIPIIVRHGTLSYKVAVSDIELVPPQPSQESPTVRFRLHRDGTRSSYGDVTVTHTPRGRSRGNVVGVLRGVALYTPNATRIVELPLSLGGAADPGGLLHVAYRAPAKEGGDIVAEAEVTLP